MNTSFIIISTSFCVSALIPDLLVLPLLLLPVELIEKFITHSDSV